MLTALIVITILLSIALLFVIVTSFHNRKMLQKKLDFFKSQNFSLSSEVDFLNNSLKVVKEETEGYNEKQNTFNTPNGIINRVNTFKGKKALIGDYACSSYYNTKLVLLSLGFEIDIVSNITDIETAIKNGRKYDVIFSNNLYRHGTGEDLLKKLKSIDNFKIPVILHSATQNLNDYAKKVGFSGFLPKPIKQEETIQLLKKLFKK